MELEYTKLIALVPSEQTNKNTMGVKELRRKHALKDLLNIRASKICLLLLQRKENDNTI